MGFPLLHDLASHGLGYLALLAATRGQRPWLASSFGFPLGLVMTFGLGLVITLIGVPLDAKWVWGAIAAALAIGVIGARAAGALTRAAWAPYGVLAALHGGIALVLSQVFLVYLPNDSWWYILLGKIAAAKESLAATSAYFVDYNAALVALNAVARTGGADYWYTLPFQLTLSASLAFAFYAYEMAGRRGFGRMRDRVMVAIACCVLAGIVSLAEFPLVVALMVNTHLHYAVLLLGFVVFAWLYLEGEDEWHASAAAILLSASIPLRLEGALVATALSLTWRAFIAQDRPGQRLPMVVPLTGVAWLTAHMLLDGGDLDSRLDHLIIIEGMSGTMMSITFITANILALVILWRIDRTGWPLRPSESFRLVLNSCFLIAIVLCLLVPTSMATNLYALGFHLLHERWGEVWKLVGIAAVCAIALRPGASDRFVWTSLLLFLFLILFAGVVRKPFHTVYTDSANRMLFHAFPIGLMAVSFTGLMAVRVLSRRDGCASTRAN